MFKTGFHLDIFYLFIFQEKDLFESSQLKRSLTASSSCAIIIFRQLFSSISTIVDFRFQEKPRRLVTK